MHIVDVLEDGWAKGSAGCQNMATGKAEGIIKGRPEGRKGRAKGVHGQAIMECRAGVRARQVGGRRGREEERGTEDGVAACRRRGQDRGKTEVRGENKDRAGAELNAGRS